MPELCTDSVDARCATTGRSSLPLCVSTRRKPPCPPEGLARVRVPSSMSHAERASVRCASPARPCVASGLSSAPGGEPLVTPCGGQRGSVTHGERGREELPLPTPPPWISMALAAALPRPASSLVDGAACALGISVPSPSRARPGSGPIGGRQRRGCGLSCPSPELPPGARSGDPDAGALGLLGPRDLTQV